MTQLPHCPGAKTERKSWSFPKIRQPKLQTTFLPLPSPLGAAWGPPAARLCLSLPSSWRGLPLPWGTPLVVINSL